MPRQSASEALRARRDKARDAKLQEIQCSREDGDLEQEKMKIELFLDKYRETDDVETILSISCLHRRLGVMQSEAEDYQGASVNFQEAIRLARELQPAAVEGVLHHMVDAEYRATISMANLLDITNKRSDALKILTELLRKAKRREDRLWEGAILVAIALNYENQLKLELAEAKLKMARGILVNFLEKKHETCYYHLCLGHLQKVLEKQNKLEEAADVGRDIHEASQLLAEADTDTESALYAQWLKALSLMRNSNFEDALIELQSWVQGAAALLGPEDYTMGEGWMNLAVCQMKLGSREEGEAAFTRAEACLQTTPDPVKRRHVLCLLRTEVTSCGLELEPARQSMLELLAMREQQGNTRGVADCKRRVGQRLVDFKVYEEAIPYLEEALEYDRDSEMSVGPCDNTCCALAECLFGLGRKEEALAACRRAEETNLASHGGDHQKTILSTDLLRKILLSMGMEGGGEFLQVNQRLEENKKIREQKLLEQTSQREDAHRSKRRNQSGGFLEEGTRLMEKGKDHLSHGRFREARIAYGRALNRFRALTSAAQSPCKGLEVGDVVETHGLSKGENNGLLGSVQRRINTDGRHVVKLWLDVRRTKDLSVKAVNLQHVTCDGDQWRLLVATCLCSRAEAWIGVQDGHGASNLAAAWADSGEAEQLTRGRAKGSDATGARAGEWELLRSRLARLAPALVQVAAATDSTAKEALGARRAEGGGRGPGQGSAKAAAKARARILTVHGGSEACRQGGLNDEECPCCMEEWGAVGGAVVMLLCRHIVCGPCMLSWAHGRKQGFSADDMHEAIKQLPVTCPCCRARVQGGLQSIQAAITAPPGVM